MVRVRYGAGGVEYIEKDPIEKEQEELEASKAEPKPEPKVEAKPKKKKKKVIQEIMGDDLKEQREMLDEII